MADQKQGKPRNPSNFWTVAEAFGAHTTEMGVGFVKSCSIRIVVLLFAGPSILYITISLLIWHFVDHDMPETFLVFGPIVLVILGLCLWGWRVADKVPDFELPGRWSASVEEERSRPAIPASVTIVNGTAGAISSSIDEEGEEA